MAHDTMTFLYVERMKDCVEIELSKHDGEARAMLHASLQKVADADLEFYREYAKRFGSSVTLEDLNLFLAGIRSKHRRYRPTDERIRKSYDFAVAEMELAMSELCNAVYRSWLSRKKQVVRHSRAQPSWSEDWFDRGVDFVTLKWLF
jgi:hypothetical protein